jgi:hypothetical protein
MGCLIFLFTSVQGFCDDRRGAWIDIPTAVYILPTEHQNGQIGKLINLYHSIEKTRLNLIDQRISTLESIHQEILNTVDKVAHDPNLKKSLQNLNVLVQKKSWYLKEVKAIYNNPLPHKKLLDIQTHENMVPLTLVNKVLYNFKSPIYWGLYYLEVLDPCHRLLTPQYLKWKNANTNIPFFLWLETQEIPYYAAQVTFLDKEEIEKCRLDVDKGLLVRNTNKEVADFARPDQEYLFIITLDKKLIVVEGNERIRHTSLSHGKPVLGSGAVKIKNGKVIYLDTECGHYQPPPESILQVMQILAEQGAKLDYANIQLKYYVDDQAKKENAQAFLEKYKGKQLKEPTSELLKEFDQFSI